MREWFIVIISLLIIGILLDGLRRKRLHRRDNIRMSRSVYKKSQATTSSDAPKENFTSELPNGGARVIGHRASTANSQNNKKSLSNNRNQQRQTPQQTRLNLDESVPLLMESVPEDILLKQNKDVSKKESSKKESAKSVSIPAHQEQQRLNDGERIEPTFSALVDDEAISSAVDSLYETTSEQLVAGSRAGIEEITHMDARDFDVHEDDAVIDDYDEDDDEYEDDVDADSENDDYTEDDDDYDSDDDYADEDDQDYDDEDDDYGNEPVDEEPQSNVSNQPQKDPEEVLIINIMAHKGEVLNGGALLDIILECGMRFGDMDIFHRYTDAKGEGALLFSMANMVKPGTFDLDAMEQFETPGVSLFMTLPLEADSLQSFDLMADTARRIAEALDGELKDEQRSVMTRQTLEHCRQRVRDYELKKLARARHK